MVQLRGELLRPVDYRAHFGLLYGPDDFLYLRRAQLQSARARRLRHLSPPIAARPRARSTAVKTAGSPTVPKGCRATSSSAACPSRYPRADSREASATSPGRPTALADANVGINWQWSADCYSNFSRISKSLGVKPCDSNQHNQYQNADNCGGRPSGTSAMRPSSCGSNGKGFVDQPVHGDAFLRMRRLVHFDQYGYRDARRPEPGVVRRHHIPCYNLHQTAGHRDQTADQSTLMAGQAAGYTVTIINTSSTAVATNVRSTIRCPRVSGRTSSGRSTAAAPGRFPDHRLDGQPGPDVGLRRDHAGRGAEHFGPHHRRDLRRRRGRSCTSHAPSPATSTARRSPAATTSGSTAP